MTAQVLLQYPIDLPADYDMGIIRERVRTIGHVLDDRAGLLMKAYCIRESGTDGSSVNQYAPFYLWADTVAAGEFLWGGTGFERIIAGFGRPQVRTWLPAAVAVGSCAAAHVRHAIVRTTPIPRGADLGRLATHLADGVRAFDGDAAVHVAAAGIDPRSWEAVEFATVADPAIIERFGSSDAGELGLFTVLHISQPGPLR